MYMVDIAACKGIIFVYNSFTFTVRNQIRELFIPCKYHRLIHNCRRLICMCHHLIRKCYLLRLKAFYLQARGNTSGYVYG